MSAFRVISKFYILSCFIGLLFFFGCSSDENIVESEIEITGEEQQEETIEVLSDFELDLITKLIIVDGEMDLTWTHFNGFRECPIYIITGEDQGILLNPTGDYINIHTPITYNVEGFEEIPLYRNELLHEFAKQAFEYGGLWRFEVYAGMDIIIYDSTYDDFDNFYLAYKNRNGHFHIGAFYHELFHLFSLFKNRETFVGDYWTQNINGYPLNEDTLPLLLLLFDTMIDAYHQDSQEQNLKYLKYYVSISHKLNELDPTEENLIRSHGFYQEKIEGSARFIEVLSTLNSINNNIIEDPTHGYKEFSDNITDRNQVRTVYAFRMFYHTGAGALHLLKQLGHPSLEEAMFIPENTPYDIAEDFLNMSETEMENALNEAKVLYDWKAILERADFLLSL